MNKKIRIILGPWIQFGNFNDLDPYWIRIRIHQILWIRILSLVHKAINLFKQTDKKVFNCLQFKASSGTIEQSKPFKGKKCKTNTRTIKKMLRFRSQLASLQIVQCTYTHGILMILYKFVCVSLQEVWVILLVVPLAYVECLVSIKI